MSASIISIQAPLDEQRRARLAQAQSQQAGQAEAAAPVRTRLRLTRRGRVVLGALATVLAVALIASIAMLGGARAEASVELGDAEFGYVVVQPGSSLWQIAGEIDAEADPRDLVSEIVRLNQLRGSGVEAGQAIAVPLRYSEVAGVVPASELGL